MFSWKKNKIIATTVFVMMLFFAIFNFQKVMAAEDIGMGGGAPGDELFDNAGDMPEMTGSDMSSEEPPSPSTETCSFSLYDGFPVFSCLRYLLATILSNILWVISAVTWVVAEIFTLVVDISINSIGSFAKSELVINSWKVLRDLVNMFALIVMMYIAIGTVLQLDGINWKKMIGTMIFAVIIINFSMAITGVVIDISNVFAVYFYDKARGGEDGNLSTIIMDKLSIAKQLESGKVAATRDGGGSSEDVPSLGAIILNSLGTLLFMIAFVFVMGTAAVLFIIRTVSLIFSLIFSPLPWIAMIIPKYGGKIDNDYWGSLINQAMFAPVFMFCLWLTMRMIVCNNIISSANSQAANIKLLGGGANVILYHTLIISFLTGSIIAAKKMGASGASSAEAFGKWATGAAITAVGGGAAIAGGTALSVSRGISKGSEGRESEGRVMGTLRNIGDEWNKTVGKPIADKVSTKTGMLGESIKETFKSPEAVFSSATGAAGSTLKKVTGFDMIPGASEAKETEKAEKEYKKRKEVSDKKNRLEEISKMTPKTQEEISRMTPDEKNRYDEEQRQIEKEIQEGLAMFRGDKILEIGLKNLTANNGRLAKWMDEAQYKAIQSAEGTKPEQLISVQDALFNNPINNRGKRMVETEYVQRNWNSADSTKKDNWIKNMSSRNVADLSEAVLLSDEFAKAVDGEDLKKIRENRGWDLVDKIKTNKNRLTGGGDPSPSGAVS